MAYIDENNDVLAGKGKDPIKELDDELDRLMAEIGEMQKNRTPEETAEADAADATPPAAEYAADDYDDAAERKTDTVKKAKYAKKPPKKGGMIAAILISCVICAGIIAGGFWIYHKLTDKISGGDTENTAPTEKFSDPELGEVTVKKVDGALNTYQLDNLVKNENGFYEYYEDGKLVSTVGIDLAEYQGDVDFEAVRNSGVDFVILRIGGRYYSDEGKLYEDGRFDDYYEQAKDAGLKVGAYFFSQAASTEEAVEEAEYVVSKLNGRELDYPVAFDWETIEDDDARTDNIGGKTITAMAEAFCDAIEKEGYESIVYSSTSLMLQSYDFETMKDYEFWLADYREFPNMYYDFAIWQYATDGEVDGISGTVDLNICFKPY